MLLEIKSRRFHIGFTYSAVDIEGQCFCGAITNIDKTCYFIIAS